jgi:magnesium transporter
MIRTLTEAGRSGVTWLDVTAPTHEELAGLAHEHGLHETTVEDCLDPVHLPKYERLEEASFVIFRVYGEEPGHGGTAIQGATRKIAVFVRGDTLITVHRTDLPVITRLELEHRHEHADGGRCSPSCLLVSLAHEVLATYDAPLDQAEELLDGFEEALFAPTGRPPDLQTLHRLKGSVSLIRRLLWMTIGVVQRFVQPQDRAAPVFQDLREAAEASHFRADQVLDEVQNLMAMHLAVGAARTNEVMRVLTIFAAFFLPLTFIVGIYGMNFHRMPELGWRLGYPLVIVGMLVVSVVIFLWFRRRGWLRAGPRG